MARYRLTVTHVDAKVENFEFANLDTALLYAGNVSENASTANAIAILQRRFLFGPWRLIHTYAYAN